MSKPVAGKVRLAVGAPAHRSFGPLMEKYWFRDPRLGWGMANVCNLVFFRIRQ